MNYPTINYKRATALATIASLAFLQARGELEIVSQTGDSVGDGLTVESFSPPSLNKYGELAFAAQIEELETDAPGKFESILLSNATGLHLLAATDQTAPKPGTDGVFEFFDPPEISELGIAMYRAKPQGPNWARYERGIWMSWLVNDPEGAYPQTDILAKVWDRALIDFLGNESEEGGKYGLLSNPIVVEPLSFAFIGDLYDGPYDGVSGIWYQDARGSESWNIPEPHLVALTGLPLPGSDLSLDRIDAYAPIDTNSGFVLAQLTHENGIDDTSDQALWLVERDAPATLALQSGQTDEQTGAPIDSISAPDANESGQAVVWASIRDASRTEVIYLVSKEGTQLIVSSHAPVAVGEQAIEVESFFNPTINDHGDIAVLATLATEGEEPHYALLSKPFDSTLRLIAQTGANAIGTFAGTAYDRISLPRLNDAGGIAFTATLDGSGDAISDTTDSGIWATDGNGELVLTLREGDTIETDERTYRTVASFDIGGYNEYNELALNLVFSNGDSAIGKATVEPSAPPLISEQPGEVDTFENESVELSVQATGQGPFRYQWYRDGEAIEGATEATLTIDSVSIESAGTYSVTVISPVGETPSEVASLSVSALPDAPVFVEDPLGDIALLGEATTLSARAVSNSNIQYQWYKNGVLIEGANEETLFIAQANEEDEAQYYATATNGSGTSQSETAEILVTDKRLVNISTRAHVGTGANVLIAGFVIGGTEPKTVLVRGVGPALIEKNVPGALANPKLVLHGPNGIIAENTGWHAEANRDEIATAAETVGAFALENGSEDAAMLLELDPGLYTAVLSGEDSSTGIALVEVYEVAKNPSRLINISSRAHVGTGHNVVIPGLVALGDLPTRVLVRAIGPGLERNGLTGLLEHPVLEVLNAQREVIASNDGWNNSAAITEAGELVRASPLDRGSQDAALIIDLEPGLYTLRISGEEGTTGLALVEMFALP